MATSSLPSQRTSEAETDSQLPDVNNMEDTGEWLQQEGARDTADSGKGKNGKNTRAKGASGRKSSGEEGTRYSDTARYGNNTGNDDVEARDRHRQFQLGAIFRVRYLVTYTSGVTELLDEDPRK